MKRTFPLHLALPREADTHPVVCREYLFTQKVQTVSLGTWALFILKYLLWLFGSQWYALQNQIYCIFLQEATMWISKTLKRETRCSIKRTGLSEFCLEKNLTYHGNTLVSLCPCCCPEREFAKLTMKFIPEKWKYILAENNLTVTFNNILSAD